MLKKILLGMLAVLLIIQFIRPEKNVSESLSPNDISTQYEVPDNVKSILTKACTDCHSNNTVYPWYSNFQPIAWLLDEHVVDGKKHFNLSEFASYEAWKAHHKLEELEEEIEKGEMPFDQYVWIHKEADLTSEEKATLIEWSKGIRAQMAADSTLDLTMPKRD
jgi:hypothetical protein